MCIVKLQLLLYRQGGPESTGIQGVKKGPTARRRLPGQPGRFGLCHTLVFKKKRSTLKTEAQLCNRTHNFPFCTTDYDTVSGTLRLQKHHITLHTRLICRREPSTLIRLSWEQTEKPMGWDSSAFLLYLIQRRSLVSLVSQHHSSQWKHNWQTVSDRRVHTADMKSGRSRPGVSAFSSFCESLTNTGLRVAYNITVR